MRLPLHIAFFACAAAFAEVPPLDYYDVITQRKPFGDETSALSDTAAARAAEKAAAEELKEQQRLAKQIQMVAVTITPAGKTCVGFVDKSSKEPKNYCVNVGETSGGWTVLEASYDDETATIKREGVTVTLKLGQGLIEGTNAAENSAASAITRGNFAPAAVSPSPPVGRRGGVIQRLPAMPNRHGAANDAAPSGGEPPTSYMHNLRERANKRNQLREQEAAKMRAELQTLAQSAGKEAAEKRERAMNLELIKKGLEPLSPIELTPEEDAELVNAGFLQAQ